MLPEVQLVIHQTLLVLESAPAENEITEAWKSTLCSWYEDAQARSWGGGGLRDLTEPLQ